QAVAVRQHREQFGKGDGFVVCGNLAVLVHGEIHHVGLVGGSGERGGGQVGLDRADNLHLQTDHHERREQEKHDVNQRNDFQPRLFFRDGRANFHFILTTDGHGSIPPVGRVTPCAPFDGSRRSGGQEDCPPCQSVFICVHPWFVFNLRFGCRS